MDRSTWKKTMPMVNAQTISVRVKPSDESPVIGLMKTASEYVPIPTPIRLLRNPRPTIHQP